MKLVRIEHSAIHSWAAGSEERGVCIRYDSLGLVIIEPIQPRMVDLMLNWVVALMMNMLEIMVDVN